MLFGNKTYDILKYITLIVLPAIGTLYFALASIWHLPYAGEVSASITAVVTCLGILLGVSSNKYNNSDARYDGVVDIHQPEDGPAQLLVRNMTTKPDEYDGKNEIIFKVNNP